MFADVRLPPALLLEVLQKLVALHYEHALK